MLKQRLLTAAVLIPLVIVCVLYLPTVIFQWLMIGVVVLAALEWFSIIGYKTRNTTVFSLVALLFIIVLGFALPANVLSISSLIIWATVLLLVSRYAHTALPAVIRKLLMQPLIALAIASLMLALFWHSAVQLHQSSDMGPQQLLYVMVLVWLADSGGYFAGKKWGQLPLAKAISPNKTWEGVAGALVFGLLWAIAGHYLELAPSLTLTAWTLLSTATLLISIVGDLFESLFKRGHKIKDSGNLLPGHGGMLDRIDSLIAAVPVFSAGLFFLGAG
ncbi:MAG: phosphatidate cytidylyltransferase [Gammaproteobacteria bacterium]|nr:phosphatidate cytidylyltransferase [Gammaproteobacteria bacterium]